MLSNEDAVIAFRDGKPGRSKNIFHKGNKLYDYGHHYVMAVRMDDGSYLINGDTYSSTTSRHTGICLIQLKPHIVIPFSALGQVVTTGMYNQIKIIGNLGDIWTPRTRIDPKTGELVKYQDHQLGASVFEFKDKHYLSGWMMAQDGEVWDIFLWNFHRKLAPLRKHLRCCDHLFSKIAILILDKESFSLCRYPM